MGNINPELQPFRCKSRKVKMWEGLYTHPVVHAEIGVHQGLAG